MNIVNQAQAVEYLKTGKTIIFPTETSYGLGCDATNQKAVDKIFKIKLRDKDKPLLVIVPTVEMAKEYLEWNELLEKIAYKFWPGALTIVGMLKSKKLRNKETKKLAIGVASKFGTLALRVTSAEAPKYLSEKLGWPIVATSANIAGAGDIYYSTDIWEMFEDNKFAPDVFLDAGILPKNPPTTIVSVVNNELKILRQGSVVVDPL